MISIKDIKGLKFPDEYFTKFFFKNSLEKKSSLKFLEFGCGNASNLMLPYEYDNEVIGVDFDSTLISYANSNFEQMKSQTKYEFYQDDMREFVKSHHNLLADVLLLPSIIYYISKDDLKIFLQDIVANKLIKKSAMLYIRLRTPKDFRFGRGEKLGFNCYQMPKNSLTGEDNAQITFYNSLEIVEILKELLNLQDYSVFESDQQNLQDGQIILNSDLILWGKIN
ncbi:MAG: class I SAM-dependent methyltransferase [Campylobacterales bacterium]|nr:class I SAM-dependent methyltransferase [Campylobacterales bacterium]